MKNHNAKPIPSLDNLYSITTDGTVISPKGRQLSTSIGNHGYLRFHAHLPNRRHTPLIHRVLAEVFLPSFWAGCEVNHIDGDKLNNSLDNLECLEPSVHNSISPKGKNPNVLYAQYVWYLFENRSERRRIYNTKVAIQQQLGFNNKQMSRAINGRQFQGWRAIACKLSSKPEAFIPKLPKKPTGRPRKVSS